MTAIHEARYAHTPNANLPSEKGRRMKKESPQRNATKMERPYNANTLVSDGSSSARRWKYVIILATGLSLWLLAQFVVGAAPALAQQGGGGDAIQGTLSNVRDYIASLLLLLGGIGFVVSLGLKAASPINENAQYLSNMGMKSSFIAVLGGAIVGPVMDIIQGLAVA